MSSSATGREVNIPKSSAPGLDPKRFAILVQRSSSELKDEHVDPPPRTSRPFYDEAIASMRKSINRLSSREMISATKKLWRDHSELVMYTGLCLALLCIMSVISINWFMERDQLVARWARLMETTGFVNWPQLQEKSSVPAFCAATPVVVGIFSAMVVPWCLFTHNAGGIKLFACALLMTTMISFVGFNLAFVNKPPMDERIIETLAPQSVAVANFNRGFCQAWCRQSEAGLAAFMRGDCGPNETKLFDELSVHFDMKDWCLEAIAHQKFELVAEYSGVSPFAGLKGNAGRALADVRPIGAPLYHLIFSLLLLFFGMMLLDNKL